MNNWIECPLIDPFLLDHLCNYCNSARQTFKNKLLPCATCCTEPYIFVLLKDNMFYPNWRHLNEEVSTSNTSGYKKVILQKRGYFDIHFPTRQFINFWFYNEEET